jgi:thiol-disulfide isomerase/thioredoxin
MMTESIRKLVLFVLLVSLSSFDGFSQRVDVIKAKQLYDLIDTCELDFCVYNFWATWCGPCIRELPEFDKLSRENKNVKVRLISLDEVEELNGSVKLFIQKRKISSKVMLLDETDFNEIIPGIDDKWSGAIPATLIVDRQGKKYFYEKEFKAGELQKTIENLPIIDN